MPAPINMTVYDFCRTLFAESDKRQAEYFAARDKFGIGSPEAEALYPAWKDASDFAARVSNAMHNIEA